MDFRRARISSSERGEAASKADEPPISQDSEDQINGLVDIEILALLVLMGGNEEGSELRELITNFQCPNQGYPLLSLLILLSYNILMRQLHPLQPTVSIPTASSSSCVE